MENKAKEKIIVIDPYKEETKTFFAMRETLMQKKKENMSDAEALNFESEFKKKSTAKRYKKVKVKKEKIKKEKVVKVKKEKIIVKSKYTFKMRQFTFIPRISITALLILNTIVFSSFIDSNGYKFVILYNNGIDFSNEIGVFGFYASILIAIIYNVYAFIKAKNIFIYTDGSAIFKSYDNNIKGNINELRINLEVHPKYFNIIIGQKQIKKVPLKHLNKLQIALADNVLNDPKMV